MALKNFTKSIQQSAPSFSKLLDDVSCLQGQEATLECCVQGYPIPEVRWEKGGIQLANSRRLHTERQGDKCRLHIKSCTRLETGVFKCIATNKFGSASTTSTVRFDAVPPKFTSTAHVQEKATSSVRSEKITEIQKNVSRLKKVVPKTEDGKTNDLSENSTPTFKDFPLKRSALSNSFRSKTETPHVQQTSLSKKSTVNGCSTAPKLVAGPQKTTESSKPVNVPSTTANTSSGVDRPQKTTSILKKINSKEYTDKKGNSSLLAESSKSNGHARSTKKEPESQQAAPQSTPSPKVPTTVQTDKNSKKPVPSKDYLIRKRKKAPKFVLPPKSKVVKESDSVKFMCSSAGFPEPTVTWKRRDTELVTSERTLCYQRDCMHILEIRDLTVEDAGDYTVTLVNEAGSASAKAILEVRARKATLVAPRIIQPLSNLSVVDGHPCFLTCEVSGVPPPICRWSKDGKVLDTNPDFKSSFDGHTATLSIEEIFLDDEGVYMLTAQNELGQIDTSCSLTVIGNVVNTPDYDTDAPVFTRKLSDCEVNDGDPFTLTVEVSGTEPMEIVWVHNESMIKNNADFRYISSEDKKCHSLVIEEMFPEDAGIYFCEVYNLYGEDVTACMVTVKIPATSSDISNDVKKYEQTVPKEQKISSEQVEKLISKVSMNPDSELKDAKIAFRRSIVKSKGSVQTDNRHRSDRMSIAVESPTSPNMEDPFLPSVLLQDQLSSESLTNKFPSPKLIPAQILKGPRSVAAFRNESITLRCQFTGSPKPTVSWIKGGKILTSSERVSLETEESQAVLTITKAVTDDSGKYVVVVENSGGSDCQFASVSVEGPPDPLAERPVVTDTTNHSLVLAWSGSPFDGGSVITGYAVEMCCLPELRWQRVSVARHSTSYVVKNLLPNRSYIFRVRAENVHGFSEPSPESEPTFISDGDQDTEEQDVFEERNVVVQNGSVFTEKYEFLEIVGKGRFGVVHRCKEKGSEEVRAAKVIRCVKQKDKQKVREEVEIMNQLRHSKLLQIIGAFENPKDLTLVMEYISGGELFERVIADDFVLLEKDCVLFLHQICEGVRYMHDNNIIHLDLKPENILCVTKTSHQIKIIDFGLARKYSSSESIRVLFGTPEFVAPEVIGYEPVSPSSDMWSVGVICYVLLSGLSPFMGDNDAETFANITRVEYDFEDDAFESVSADAKNFINMLFKKRPEKRLSAAECLKHIWLAKDQNRMSVVQLCTDKLKKFIIRRKWQKTGNAIRALGRIVSMSSPSRSISSFSSQSDSELSFTLQTQTSLSCSPSVTDKDEDTESGVFINNDCPSLGQVKG